ncbi:MAG: hypothetical protein FWG10_08625 [Eubacteriaceae bacterium]|nr:hypothetical protein [Eubacteriaceae bacterium]
MSNKSLSLAKNTAELQADASDVKRRVQIRRISRKSNKSLIVACLVFLVLSTCLVFQRNEINNLDSQIRELEIAHNRAVSINDDLRGQILKVDKSQIERYAVNVLGMVKADAGDVERVSFNVPKKPAPATEQKAKGGFGAAINSLMRLFS